ncbi:MAG: dihydrodipicolinate synthase family protein [Salinarimonas sp.]|nr:dihydrodipicolinate synthase family protein [Salinarimonas sp.]
MFTGLSAFPLTPLDAQGVDEIAYIGLIRRLADARVDSIGALGSTGSYPYLDRAERRRAAELAVAHAGEIPVMVGIGALRQRDVLRHAEDAQAAGASALLLAPVSYQPLRPDEVYALFEAVAQSSSVPICVYDNPRTTHFSFDDDLYAALAALPQIASIKIPGVPADPDEACAHVARLRGLLPARVTIGVSGDAFAATGLNAGCDAWYSVIGGLFPETALALTRAAQAGDAAKAVHLSQELAPFWDAFTRNGGGLRVVATAATLMGLTKPASLPAPLAELEGEERGRLADMIATVIPARAARAAG